MNLIMCTTIVILLSLIVSMHIVELLEQFHLPFVPFVRINHICTLTDVERFILEKNKDFNGAKCFDDLGIGKLYYQPFIVRLFQLPQNVTKFPEITSGIIWDNIVEKFPATFDEAWNPTMCIKQFLEEKYGVRSLTEGGIRCAADKFLVWLISSARRARYHSEAAFSRRYSVVLSRQQKCTANISGRDLLKNPSSNCG